MAEEYDKVFGAALDIHRGMVGRTSPPDVVLTQIAALMFAIVNEWEKDPDHFPSPVMDAAVEVAGAWERVVLGGLDALVQSDQT